MIKNKYFQFLVIGAVAFSVGKFSSNVVSDKTEENKTAETSTQKNDVVIERETVRPDGTRIVTKRIDKTQKDKSSQVESKSREIVNEPRPNFMIGYSYGVRNQSHGIQVQKRLVGELYFGPQFQFDGKSEVYLILSYGF